MPVVEAPVELIPRMTYFLSPGPRSWMDSPGISPAMSMIPAEPERCSASPEIAWMDTGVSRTFVAFSLLAVTTISARAELSGTGASAAAAGRCSVAIENTPARQSVTARESSPTALMRRDIGRFLLVIVVDAGIVARADHADDVDAVGG